MAISRNIKWLNWLFVCDSVTGAHSCSFSLSLPLALWAFVQRWVFTDPKQCANIDCNSTEWPMNHHASAVNETVSLTGVVVGCRGCIGAQTLVHTRTLCMYIYNATLMRTRKKRKIE